MISRGDCAWRFGNQPDTGCFFICQSAKLYVLFNYYEDINVTRLPLSVREKCGIVFYIYNAIHTLNQLLNLPANDHFIKWFCYPNPGIKRMK